MSTADRKLVPVTSEIVLGEVGRAGGVQSKELLHIEDLDARVDGLGANDGVVAKDSNFAPLRTDRVVLREATEVDKLAFAGDLCKRGAIVLANCYELTAILRSPSPRRGASTDTAELCVWQEVVQVNLFSLNHVTCLWYKVRTLLHLNVLFLSPGMAAANPFSQAVYPSSGYRELFIAPEASSASHSAYNTSATTDSKYRDELTIFIPMMRACTDPSAYSSAEPRAAALLKHTRDEQSAARESILIILTSYLYRRWREDATATDQHSHLCKPSINTPDLRST